MKRTRTQLRVAAALMADPAERHWGYDLMKRADMRAGVLYPILARMLTQGWLEDGWEDTATVENRPRRRYYVVTDAGRAALTTFLAGQGADS